MPKIFFIFKLGQIGFTILADSENYFEMTKERSLRGKPSKHGNPLEKFFHRGLFFLYPLSVQHKFIARPGPVTKPCFLYDHLFYAENKYGSNPSESTTD